MSVHRRVIRSYIDAPIGALRILVGLGLIFGVAIPFMPNGPASEPQSLVALFMAGFVAFLLLLYAFAMWVFAAIGYVRVVTDGESYVFLYNRRVSVHLTASQCATEIVGKGRGLTVRGAEELVFISPGHMASRILERMRTRTDKLR